MQPNQPVTIDAVMGLLRDGALRRFRIDIEADSTITGDESQERQDRTAFIQTTTQFVQAWAPLLMQNPKLVNMAGDLLLFGVRSFRVGRELEETIEETMDQIEDAVNAPQPPPGPTPEQQVEQVKLETEKVKSQAEIAKAHYAAQATIAEADVKTKGSEQVLGLIQNMGQALQQHQQALGVQHQAIQQLVAQNQATVDAQNQLIQGLAAQNQEHSANLAQGLAGLHEAMSRPKRVVRGPNNEVIGVE